MAFLNPIESSFHWAWKYEMYSNNWYYHQRKHAIEVVKWRQHNTLKSVK